MSPDISGSFHVVVANFLQNDAANTKNIETGLKIYKHEKRI
jgi:hypothetical protein